MTKIRSIQQIERDVSFGRVEKNQAGNLRSVAVRISGKLVGFLHSFENRDWALNPDALTAFGWAVYLTSPDLAKAKEAIRFRYRMDVQYASGMYA